MGSGGSISAGLTILPDGILGGGAAALLLSGESGWEGSFIISDKISSTTLGFCSFFTGSILGTTLLFAGRFG